MADIYQIRVEGHLDPDWTDWFDGLTITLEADGATLLAGPVIDQSALHGLLKKIRDLGLTLLLVQRVEEQERYDTPSPPPGRLFKPLEP